MAGFAQPERAGSAKVEAVVAAIDLKSCGEASGTAGEIVDDDFPDEETSEHDGVRGKFRATETANSEFGRRGFQSRARWGHGMSSQRESSFWRSSEETRS